MSLKKILFFVVGSKEIAELLIRKGADINTDGQDGNTPLILAAYRGNSKQCDRITRINTNLSPVDPHLLIKLHRLFPINFICFAGFEQIVDTLIENGADINHTTKHSESALIYAALNGNYFL